MKTISTSSYFSDQRLEIIVLGPMRGEKKDTSRVIHNAIYKILQEKKSRDMLGGYGISEDNIKISYPEQWKSASIEGDVFFNLDTADLVVFNITPRENETNATPNVFYELGLVHALGLPYLLVIQEGHEVPFYMRSTRYYEVKDFKEPSLVKVLREPIQTFIANESTYSFTENIISRFYEGLPVVDISAAVGLATGYYINFVSRILKDGGFISHYPDKIKRLVVVRPVSVFNTYEQDMETLRQLLKENGLPLTQEKLAPIATDKDGAIWFDHLNGTVVDIPRMIYPIKRSPRILSLRKRMDSNPKQYPDKLRTMLLNQTADKLLDRIEDIIRYHIRNDGERVRESLLEFTTVQGLAGRLKRFH